ncbi:MAG TPA: nucleotide sugar dehydrogenase [Ktedonobacterales bacterium]|nr:nucleotide sugar dehydrogenase [Ktedonobacterales bacterium]
MHGSNSLSPAPDQNSGTVAVVGLGKIGLPLAVQYVRQGRTVIGCDINAQIVAGINAGQCHVHEEPGLEDEVATAVAGGKLRAETDTTHATRQADVIVVIVPVVVTPDHQPDFRAIDAATRAVGEGLESGKLVIYETTLPVGTTAGRLRRLLEEASGLVAGRDFLLAYSPERVSSGHIFRDLATYPKVVGGIDEASTEAVIAFYRSVLDAQVIRMPSTNDAEFVKLIETTYRDVNIALANEYAQFADARGLDVGAAIAAANTQPYSHIHTPGVGVGGHCIPVYPYFLMDSADTGLALPRASRIINDSMATYAAERIEAVLGSLSGQGVLILGIAYRKNVRETAFSTARLLQAALVARGACVYVHDPLYTAEEIEAMGYTALRESSYPQIRAMIVQADHQEYETFDFSQFHHCELLFDGRQAFSPERFEALGMRYLRIGGGEKMLSPAGS